LETYVYLFAEAGTLKAFRVRGGRLDLSPIATSRPLGGTTRAGLALSANGSADGSGVLWVTSGDYSNTSVPPVLHAFDASNLAHEIWNSEMSPGDRLHGFVKFVPPTVANGKVYAASSNAVVVYGPFARGG
jgi:outer membrane protein assembly factor BamB